MQQRILSCLLLICVAGCATWTERPDLKRLYEHGSAQTAQPPLILIPGLMGTRLADRKTGKEVWPGSATRILFSRFDQLALRVSSVEPEPADLVPTKLTDQVAGQDFYRSIMRTLEQDAGYRRAEIGETLTPGRNYYVFAYDWRQDLQQTAAALYEFVRAVQADYGDPELKVDILAHSMGGLIARYFIRYGAADVLNDNELSPNMAGAALVRRVILLGVPNLGAVEAISSLIEGRKLGLQAVRAETLASMPSLYQLVPHTINNWLVTNEGKPLDRDIFDVRLWKRFEWSIFDERVRSRIRAEFSSPAEAEAHIAAYEELFERYLERARRFLWSLTVPAGTAVPLIVFGGDCQLTPARLLVEEVDGRSEIRRRPSEVVNRESGIDYSRLLFEPGDGVVTKASLLAKSALDPTTPRHRYSHFSLDYSLFLCVPHNRMPADVSFQDNLLDALLRAER